MAMIRLDHVPQTVKVNIPLYMVLPDPGDFSGFAAVSDLRLLYLLHGLSDDGSAWLRHTSVERIAARYGLVVVMPSAGRSFYTDQPNGQNYFTYLVEELPEYIGNVFGIRHRRERTFIAGASMGGYGAFKAAFLRPELYAAAASFSGFLSMDFLKLYPDDPRIQEFTHIFGDLNNVAGSEHDPATWLKKAAENPDPLPKLYMACGTEDDLQPLNALFYNECRSRNIPIQYNEEKNAYHDWDFWDAQLGKFLDDLHPQFRNLFGTLKPKEE